MEQRKTQIDWKNVFELGFILFVISAVAACCLAGLLRHQRGQAVIEARQS